MGCSNGASEGGQYPLGKLRPQTDQTFNRVLGRGLFYCFVRMTISGELQSFWKQVLLVWATSSKCLLHTLRRHFGSSDGIQFKANNRHLLDVHDL